MIERKIVVRTRVTEHELGELERLAGEYTPTKNGKPNISAYMRKCIFERPEAFANNRRDVARLRLEVRKANSVLNRVINFDELSESDLQKLESVRDSFTQGMDILKGDRQDGDDDHR